MIPTLFDRDMFNSEEDAWESFKGNDLDDFYEIILPFRIIWDLNICSVEVIDFSWILVIS